MGSFFTDVGKPQLAEELPKDVSCLPGSRLRNVTDTTLQTLGIRSSQHLAFPPGPYVRSHRRRCVSKSWRTFCPFFYLCATLCDDGTWWQLSSASAGSIAGPAVIFSPAPSSLTFQRRAAHPYSYTSPAPLRTSFGSAPSSGPGGWASFQTCDALLHRCRRCLRGPFTARECKYLGDFKQGVTWSDLPFKGPPWRLTWTRLWAEWKQWDRLARGCWPERLYLRRDEGQDSRWW